MIRLEGLRVSAGDFMLQIDELALQSGEYLVILGPTGSGKTFLLDTIAGMRQPAQGKVWFGERDVTRDPPERRRTGFVYQDYALFPHLTVAGNIGFGLRVRRKATLGADGAAASHGTRTAGTTGADHGATAGASGVPGAGLSGRGAACKLDRAAQVERLASLLGIQGLLDRYPDSLSGGERQRVALARALAIEPDVLLLDEPLSALDRTTRRELRDELKRLHQTLRATVLHVTHDLDEALTLGDRVAVLVDGRVRQVGIPAEVVRRPADGAVARLVGMTNVFPIVSTTEAVDAAAVGPPAVGPMAIGATAEGIVRVRLGATGSGGSSLEPDLTAFASPPGRFGSPALAVIPAEEILLSKAHDTDGSLRGEEGAGSLWNVLTGIVTAVQLQSVHASITVDVPPLFVVNVLRPDVERMGLSVGSRVTLRIPPDSIHICPE